MKQRKSPIVVLGAGGHAKVVLATMKEAGISASFVLDDDQEKWGKAILGVPVIGDFSKLVDLEDAQAVVAIGDNVVRKKVVETWSSYCSWLTVIHPQAYVHPTAKIDEGSVVFAGACIQPDVTVGEHAIVNTGVIIDHDCRIEDFVHIGPGAALAGGVWIKEGAFLGIGCKVVPGKTVGEWATVGAGAVVIQDIPAFAVAVGIPAREIKRKSVE